MPIMAAIPAVMGAMGGATGIASAIGGTLLSSVLNKQKDSGPAAPTVQQAPTMPLPDDQAVQNARRRSIQQQISRRGRASTILSDNGAGVETLG
jgi:hypothetical protein